MENTELVFGTYENLILGYKIIRNLDGSYGLETSFTDDSHRGALRCLSVSPTGTLASSSTDDSIRLHSLSKRKEIGGLFEHSGTVNCLVFYKGNHMFSASEDGTVCMWKLKNWEMLRTLKGHKSHVMAVAVHPSGKLGLSIGRDRSFLTWDLITGKLAFQRKIKEAAQNILFTSSGDHYILVYFKKIEVCSLEDTETVQEISTEWRINAVCFIQNNVMAIGGDDRHILIVDILTGEQLLTLDMARPDDGSFSSRVRCISVEDCEENKLVLVATANGNVKVFKLFLKERKADMLLFYDTRVRVTCMAVYNPANGSQSKEPVQLKQADEETSKGKAQKKKMVTLKPSDESDDEDYGNYSRNEDVGNNSHRQVKKRKLSQGPPKQQKKKKRKDSIGNGGNADEAAKFEPQSNEGSRQRSEGKKKKKRKQLQMMAGSEKQKLAKTSDQPQKSKKKKKKRVVVK